MKTLFCKICEKPIPRHRDANDRRSYCSEVCSKRAHQTRQLERRRNCNLQARLGLPGGSVGKINEMIVAVDLTKRGYDVYTPFSPTAPFDLLAVRSDGVTYKVEVKTETVLPSGTRLVAMKKGQKGKHDILAKVANLSEITYSPPLPE